MKKTPRILQIFLKKSLLFYVTRKTLGASLLIWFIGTSMGGLPPHVETNWKVETEAIQNSEAGKQMRIPRFGVDPHEMDLVTSMSEETWRAYYRETGSIEAVLISVGALRNMTTPGLLWTSHAWREMNPHRPKSVSLEQEMIEANGDSNWWPKTRAGTCASHAGVALLRHMMVKHGMGRPNWDPDTLLGRSASMEEVFETIRRKYGVKFRVLDISNIPNNDEWDTRERDTRTIWVPVLEEIMKQEIAAGRPVTIGVFSAPPAMRGKHGWDYTLENDLGGMSHAVVVVGYTEEVQEDGRIKTTYRVWDCIGPRTKGRKGMVNMTDDYFRQNTYRGIYSVRP